MQMIKTTALLLAILMMGACSGENESLRAGNQTSSISRPAMSAVAGSSLEGIAYSFEDNELSVTFESVQSEGQFVEFQLPKGVAPIEQNWKGNAKTVSLMLQADGVMQVGVAPLATYLGNEVNVRIPLRTKVRRVSQIPGGNPYQLIDLTLEDMGDGSSKLEWSEVNRGDYDFNGEVNIADITPIAILFGQSSLIDEPGTRNFWVDGDNNSEINLSDIVPIAIYFRNSVVSYRVDAPDGTPVFVPRETSLARPNLPNKYSVTIPGSTYDTWQVSPINAKGDVGDPTIPPVPDPDLLLDINIVGMDLFSLDGSGNFEPPGGPGLTMSYLVELDPLRRLMPGEIPNMVEIGSTLNNTTPSMKLYGMPRDRHLALLVMFVPTIDLITGDPRDIGGLPGLDIWAYEPAVTIVPINLHDTELNSLASVNIFIEPGPIDGYYSNITTTGLGLQPGFVKLDNADGVLWRDSNGNLDLEDEARMLDEPRWGITASRLVQLGQLDEYVNGENLSYTLSGIVDAFNQESGEISLRETMIDFDGPEEPFILGDIVMAFSEYSTFASKLFGFEEETPINPGDIEFGTELEIRGYKLTDDLGGLEAVYWGDHIVKVIR